MDARQGVAAVRTRRKIMRRRQEAQAKGEVTKTSNPLRKIRRLRITRNRRPGWTYLVPRRCSTPQDKWDDQIRLNQAYVESRHRWIPLARWVDFLFITNLAGRILDDAACGLDIAFRMEACPNNPRNGGDGFDMGDGTWRDRRWTP